MRLEVLNTGSELLLGSVLNTHLRIFSDALFPLGLRIARQVAVPDGLPIREALAETFGRADIVLITGGLGPTTDDITPDARARAVYKTVCSLQSPWAVARTSSALGMLRTGRFSMLLYTHS